MADWASLPADLINRVADRLLAADDLDYYMDFRAVCRSWRSSTADPKKSPLDPRFRPRLWAMLDEVHQSDADRLFVNAGTGRFVRKALPLLRRYFLVAGAAGGSIILAEKSPPHAARVLNPFTGSMVAFEAPVPPELEVAAHVLGSSPTLVLHRDKSATIYWADPGSKSFIKVREENFPQTPIYAAIREDGSMPLLAVPPLHKAIAVVHDLPPRSAGRRCFFVESAGEMLLVLKRPRRIEILKMDIANDRSELVKNLGSRALFVGDCRCLSVDAEKFASVEANCIYYVVEEEPGFDICVYSLEDETEVRVGRAIDSFNPVTVSVDPPFSEVQLLCSYTSEVRISELGWNQMFSSFKGKVLAANSFDELITGFDSESDDGDMQQLMFI